MTRKVDISSHGYAASMKPHNRLLSIAGVIFQWLGAFYVLKAYGWQSLLSYIILLFVFTYFVGTPAIVNVLRCARAYQGRASHLIFSLLMQCAFAGLMVFFLRLSGLAEMTAFFILLGIIRAFSMPKNQLMQERVEFNEAQASRQARDQDTV